MTLDEIIDFDKPHVIIGHSTEDGTRGMYVDGNEVEIRVLLTDLTIDDILAAAASKQ